MPRSYAPDDTTCLGCGTRLRAGARAQRWNGKWMHPRCAEIASGRRSHAERQAKRRGVKAPKLKTVKSEKTIRQAPLSARDYKRYMASNHWANRKRVYYSAHPKRCVVCDGNVKIHLHHMTYERLGCELDEDLVALCELHHAGAHEHHQIYKGTLKEATLRYIARLQEIYS